MGNGNVYVSTKCSHSCNQLATINCYNRMVTIKHTRVSDAGVSYIELIGRGCSTWRDTLLGWSSKELSNDLAMKLHVIHYFWPTTKCSLNSYAMTFGGDYGVCVCVWSQPPVEGGCPLTRYQPHGKFTPPNTCDIILPFRHPISLPLGRC